MTGRAAILYAPRGANAGADRLMGMQVANAGFLAAYLAHGSPGPVHVHAADDEAFRNLRENFPSDREIVGIPYPHLTGVAEPGCLHLPGPALAERAWLRRALGGTAFSITGVTHAMSTRRALDAVREMLIAPMQPWDALICASTSIRQLVERVIEAQAEALAEVLGSKPVFRPRLPVIPLGVDVPSFDNPDRETDRRNFRAANGIATDGFVALYLGRLSSHDKAHPSALYQALEETVQRTGQPITLIQAGWFPAESTREMFAQAAEALAPNVGVLTVDARNADTKRQVLATADVFVSLADNIQESFGLTPLEAMASGLPCVVSDWDGYRDTVADGENGMLVPTLLPPPGAGADLAWRLATGVDDQLVHGGLVAQHVAVDVAACARALEELARSPELRQRMGAAGQARAARLFDWPVIIRAHEALWTELAERRGAAPAMPPWRAPVHPDPFELFAGFATRTLGDGVRLIPIDGAAELFERHAATRIAAIDPRLLQDGRELLAHLLKTGPLTIPSPIPHAAAEAQAREFRTLTWLAKLGVLRVEED